MHIISRQVSWLPYIAGQASTCRARLHASLHCSVICCAQSPYVLLRVAPGSARMFRCLAENMASADFGQACQISVMRKLRRREANWRLDPPLRQACKPDVDK